MPQQDTRNIEALQAEVAQLREQLALRDQALDVTPSHFMISQRKEPDNIIIYANRAMAESYGYEAAELIGKSIRLLAPVNWTDEDVRQLRSVLTQGLPFRAEEQVRRKDGSLFWLGMTVLPLRNPAGQVTHTVRVASDITARREEERKKKSCNNSWSTK